MLFVVEFVVEFVFEFVGFELLYNNILHSFLKMIKDNFD